jgi:hypothetical protein
MRDATENAFRLTSLSSACEISELKNGAGDDRRLLVVIVFGDGLAMKAVAAGQTAMTETSVLENFMF